MKGSESKLSRQLVSSMVDCRQGWLTPGRADMDPAISTSTAANAKVRNPRLMHLGTSKVADSRFTCLQGGMGRWYLKVST